MERIRDTRHSGIHRNALRTWGMLFLVIGIVGRSIVQYRMLGLGIIAGEELLSVLESSPNMMMAATMALILQALETCALPIFAFLLVEGYQHTSDLRKYLLRVLGVAVLSEIPYDLAMNGKLLDLSVQNPAFGLVLSLVVLYFYGTYAGKGMKNIFIKLLVTVCAMGWASMLRIEYAACMVLVVAVLKLYWDKPMLRNIAGATMTVICSVNSLFFMAAPMGFLAVHFYNGEKPDEENRYVNYLAYPVSLLAVALIGRFVL